MAKYLLLIYSDQSAVPDPGSPEGQAEFQHWMSYTEELGQSGAMISGNALQSTDTATSVRIRDGEEVITDGPFAETKEQLAGYYLVDVDSLDAALAWAKKMPNVGYGTVEVRPIMEFDEA